MDFESCACSTRKEKDPDPPTRHRRAGTEGFSRHPAERMNASFVLLDGFRDVFVECLPILGRGENRLTVIASQYNVMHPPSTCNLGNRGIPASSLRFLILLTQRTRQIPLLQRQTLCVCPVMFK